MPRRLEAGRGVELARPPALHRVCFSHPLMHDLLTLTGYMGVEQIATTTWATVPALSASISLRIFLLSLS